MTATTAAVAAEIPVIRMEQIDLRFAPKPWAFAEERREEIAAYSRPCNAARACGMGACC